VSPVVTCRVQTIDKLDEACTNADDRMMLVRHRSGDRVMSWREFEHSLSGYRQASGFVKTAAGRTANDSLHDARAKLKVGLQ